MPWPSRAASASPSDGQSGDTTNAAIGASEFEGPRVTQPGGSGALGAAALVAGSSSIVHSPINTTRHVRILQETTARLSLLTKGSRAAASIGPQETSTPSHGTVPIPEEIREFRAARLAIGVQQYTSHARVLSGGHGCAQGKHGSRGVRS
jgi:hypothetical protein